MINGIGKHLFHFIYSYRVARSFIRLNRVFDNLPVRVSTNPNQLGSAAIPTVHVHNQVILLRINRFYPLEHFIQIG